MSQQTLANAVGVQRSAVAQWERKNGAHPSMQHLVAIAVVTGVSLEWLGTGRGMIKPGTEIWTPAVIGEEYAQDDLEALCLKSIRKIPLRMRENVVALLVLAAKSS
ncbi:helix-turn-helix domain-containing protein [Lysobacter sp. CFH 32150]|nr:helix-turn-helix domain-containing protein [Lysobacter sp. CFH 32150]